MAMDIHFMYIQNELFNSYKIAFDEKEYKQQNRNVYKNNISLNLFFVLREINLQWILKKY